MSLTYAFNHSANNQVSSSSQANPASMPMSTSMEKMSLSDAPSSLAPKTSTKAADIPNFMKPMMRKVSMVPQKRG